MLITSRFGSAKVNIAALSRCADSPSHLEFAHPTEAVGIARYDFTRLRTGQFDLACNQIVVYVVDASAASEVSGAVRRAGIPADAVATIIVAH